MNKNIYHLAFVATAFLATACSDSEVNDIQNTQPIPDSQKEMINLSVGLGENIQGHTTRAISDPTYTGFTQNTRILMRIQSDDTDDATGNHRYTKTLAHAIAKETDKNYSKVNQTSVDGAYVRYWDDAFGRNAHLSVFAVAIPNKDDATLLAETSLQGSNTTWETTANHNKISWSVNNSNLPDGKKLQTEDVLKEQDLVFSNNIQKTSTVGGRYVHNFENGNYVPNIDQTLTGENVFKTGRMQFALKVPTDPSSPGKFDKGHLIFEHALSRLTVTIKAGTGFDAASKFVLSEEGIQALNMNVSGDLDVQAGTWTISSTKGNITTKPTVERSGSGATATAKYTTTMQMLPNYVFAKDNNTNVLKFNIDDNEYYITQHLIYSALKENASNNGLESTATEYSMLQGKNYVLSITVNKTKVESLTATLAEWQEIAGVEQTLHNSYITLNLKSPTGTTCEDFVLYRMGVGDDQIHTNQTGTTANDYVNKSWMGDYKESVTPTKNTTTGKWDTSWFYEDNKTFYHFRTVKTGTTVILYNDNNSNENKDDGEECDDYFKIKSGAIEGSLMQDPHWGAPMESSTATEYTYSPQSATNATGYGSNILKAIGSTESEINIQEFHMLSEIHVIVKTVEGGAGVNLYDNKGTSDDPSDDVKTKVTLYQFKDDGQVKMGNGLVIATGDATKEQELAVPTTFFKQESPAQTLVTNAFTWRVVPQVLSRGGNKTDKIAIKIQTPDNNLYYCIEDLSTITPSGSTDPIIEWLPNHRYVYTFKISKKGIENITCTVADWVTVEAGNKDITLED